jgi:orotate phosphoribosyltransferase
VLALQDFIDTGALLEGHFGLSSGLHSGRYLQCARLLQWPERAEAAGRELAARLSEFGPTAVVAPALGGLIIGHETARALSTRFLFVERQEGTFALRRGFGVEPGEKLVVVEDVFTTGKSTNEAIRAVETAGAVVVAAGSLVDRGLGPHALPVPWRALLSLPVPAWAAAECPLCRQGVPVDTPGSRFAGSAAGRGKR